jgi:hypothetical protein
LKTIYERYVYVKYKERGEGMKKVDVRSTVLIMCAIFAFCCVLFAFMPHLHECTGSECATCALIKDAIDALVVLNLAVVISPALVLGLVFFAHFDAPVSVREITPVGRKVKLSD